MSPTGAAGKKMTIIEPKHPNPKHESQTNNYQFKPCSNYLCSARYSIKEQLSSILSTTDLLFYHSSKSMGSDSIRKSSRLRFLYITSNRTASLNRTLLLSALSIILILAFIKQETSGNKISKLRRTHPYLYSTRELPQSDIASAKETLPRQCHNILEDLNRCQSSKQIIVFGCHRKWCSSSYGHCEEVNGIGDRTQRMLSMVTDAISNCARVEFDYPQTRNGIDLRFPTSLEYRDPWGAIAELFHFRSYDVADQGRINVESWGTGHSGSDDAVVHRTFTHFTPEDYKWHHYDPCLYHILFKTEISFQTDVNYYADLFKLNEGNTIGIHFRTGDLTAFGVKNKDIRAQGQSLESSYNKMVSCAESLATRLNLKRGSEKKRLNFFLATDNQKVKDMATNDERYNIHMTKEKPSPYLDSDGDRTAYLDLYLLSKTQGLTVNVLPDIYDGPAERVSTFARLSWNIGFMNDNQLYECEIG